MVPAVLLSGSGMKLRSESVTFDNTLCAFNKMAAPRHAKVFLILLKIATAVLTLAK